MVRRCGSCGGTGCSACGGTGAGMMHLHHEHPGEGQWRSNDVRNHLRGTHRLSNKQVGLAGAATLNKLHRKGHGIG